MDWPGDGSSQVRVTFVDVATGESFAVTEMPPDDLPESFEHSTTLHLGEDDWSVVDGQPKTRAEFSQSKSLTLHLRRVEKLDVSELLYSLPTICDRVPPLHDGPIAADAKNHVLHEDEWCQIEFAARDDREYLTRQVAQLRQFKIDHWTGHAWKNIFVRPDHPTEFATLGISVDGLQRALANLSPDGVLVYPSYVDPTSGARSVVGGFSFRVNEGTVIYGHQVHGVIASLAAHIDVQRDSVTKRAAGSLGAIAQLAPLLLVDWNTETLVEISNPNEIHEWLTLLTDAAEP